MICVVIKGSKLSVDILGQKFKIKQRAARSTTYTLHLDILTDLSRLLVDIDN